MSTPKTHIHDFYVTTDLDENYRDATLIIDALVTNFNKENLKDYSIRASLFDDKKKQILTKTLNKSGAKRSRGRISKKFRFFFGRKS